MKKTRSAILGEALAVWMNYTVNTIPSEERAEYRLTLMEEIKNYCFKPERLENCDIQNSVDLSKIVKELMNFMYQKQTANRVIEALIENLSK